MKTITVQTHKKDEVVDLTERVTRELPATPVSGICFLTLKHTTCALTLADLDPGTDLDLLDALRTMVPKLAYRHPHNPQHAPDHILASIIGAALWVAYENNALVLGKWQSVVLAEFNGPKQREIALTFTESK